MLNSFRSFSNGITTKLLLLLLIGSFALWGVGDMLGPAQRHHALAKVGDENISVDGYRHELSVESEQVRRSLGANYSQELLKRLNVPTFVLRRMIQKSLLAQEAKRMGFIPDDTSVALEIRKTPAFLGNSGVFDKARFENALRSQGVSEKTFVENLRMQLATDRLLDALLIELPVNDAMLKNMQAAFSQGREVNIYKLSAEMLSDTAAATDAELGEFHRSHAALFTAPEVRTVSFVRFTLGDVGSAGHVTEQAIQSYYNTHEDQFRTPEKREVEQLLYSSEEKAHEAYELVKQGKKFQDIAKQTDPLNRDALSLGVVDKKSIPEAAAETVFRLKAGGVTEPVKSPFGWHIFRVASVEPEGVQPLEKVRAQIEAEMKQEGHENALTDKINQIEDALAGGSTLTEAASSMGMKIEQAGTFDKQGNTPQGGANKSLPDLEKFIEVAFKTDEKTESSVITSRNGVYYVLRVENVAPDHLRPLAEVKGEVTKAYAKYEADKKIADLASKIDQELAKGKSAKEIISAHKLPVAASGAVYRDSKTLGSTVMLPSFTAQIFSAGIGALTAPSRDKDGNYVLAHINGVTAPSASAGNDVATRKKEITQSMQEEMMIQYLRHLEMIYPVEINQGIFDQLTQDNSDATR